MRTLISMRWWRTFPSPSVATLPLVCRTHHGSCSSTSGSLSVTYSTSASTRATRSRIGRGITGQRRRHPRTSRRGTIRSAATVRIGSACNNSRTIHPSISARKCRTEMVRRFSGRCSSCSTTPRIIWVNSSWCAVCWGSGPGTELARPEAAGRRLGAAPQRLGIRRGSYCADWACVSDIVYDTFVSMPDSSEATVPISGTGRAWLILITAVPSKPDYLRVKLRRRVQRLGAVGLKGAVYVLPDSPDAIEGFQWLRREILADGGDATVCVAHLVDGMSNADVIGIGRA